MAATVTGSTPRFHSPSVSKIITFGAALYAFYILHPQPPYLLNHSVCYNYYPYDFTLGLSTYPLLLVLYFAFTFIPGLFSSHRVFRLFCILSALSAAVALYFYTEHFTSVWCFLAAVLSLVILYQPRSKKTKPGR